MGLRFRPGSFVSDPPTFSSDQRKCCYETAQVLRMYAPSVLIFDSVQEGASRRKRPPAEKVPKYPTDNVTALFLPQHGRTPLGIAVPINVPGSGENLLGQNSVKNCMYFPGVTIPEEAPLVRKLVKDSENFSRLLCSSCGP